MKRNPFWHIQINNEENFDQYPLFIPKIFDLSSRSTYSVLHSYMGLVGRGRRVVRERGLVTKNDYIFRDLHSFRTLKEN